MKVTELRYQLTRFLALMNNFSVAQNATSTAINSTGSSMKEQEKYSNSLEARINRLDTAWNKFTLSMGKAVLTDGLISGIETLNSLATSVSKFIDKFGALGAIFGIVGIATLALNAKFKTLSIGLIFGTQGMTRMQLASAGLTAGMGRLGIATIGVKTAFRGLLAASLVGGAFVVLGYVIEKLIGSYSKAKQAQEDFEESQQKNIDALSTNKQETESLIDQYNAMSDARKRLGDNWSIDQENKYLEVQQRLADLFPNLISYIDSAGKKHLKSKTQIEQEVKATNDLIKAKKEEMKANAYKTFEKGISKVSDAETDVSKKEETRNVYDKTQDDSKEKTAVLAKLDREILAYKGKVSQATQEIIADVLKVASAYPSLEIDPTITRSVDEFISSLDFTKKLSPTQYDTLAQKVGVLTESLQKAYQAGDDAGFENAKKSLSDYLQTIGVSELQANGLVISLGNVKQAAELGATAIFAGKEGMDGLDESTMDAQGSVEGLSDGLNGLSSAAGGTTSALEGTVTASELLFGITADQITMMENATAIVQALGEQENLSAQQKYILAQAIGYLSEMYPQLNGEISANIEWIASQGDMLSALSDVSGSHAYNMIKDQDAITKSTLSEVNSRIRMYQTEIDALSKVYDQMVNMANELAKQNIDTPMSGAKWSVVNRLKNARVALATDTSTAVKITHDSGVKTGQIKTPDSSGKKGGKTGAGKTDTKDDKFNKKVDKTKKPYEDKLADNDKDIAASEKRNKKNAEGSKKWLAELQKQITLQGKKVKTTNDEIKALQDLEKTEKLSEAQKKELDSQIKDLKNDTLDYLNAIADVDHAIQESAINKKIAETEKLYNKEIDALQKKLDMMDEEEKKQDRINRKKEMQDAIDKAKSDTRYEYVDKNGNVQLTYDKAEVARLEKEKTDQQAEWDKEDARAALEKKIAEAEANRDKAVANLEKLQEKYLTKSYKDTADLKKLMKQFTKDLDKTFKNGTVSIKKHHSGGIVGQTGGSSRLSSLVNDLFNVKPNEEIVKALKGEVMIPASNIPNGLANIQQMVNGMVKGGMVQSNVTNYNMSNFTIQADNAQELFKNLDMHIRMNKS